MAVLILLMALAGVARGDPNNIINIHLCNDGRPAAVNNSISGYGALRKKVNMLTKELTETKRKATKTESDVRDLYKKMVDLFKGVASGDQNNDRPNKCNLEKVDCGKCRCRQDERLVSGYYCDCRHHPPMKDCASFKAAGFHKSGVYVINMTTNPLMVFCDQQIDGGGWIVFQRRLDGVVDFYRNWQWYKQGFGAIQHEHWLGNDHIHQLTKSNKMQLRIEMTYFQGQWKKFYAKYTQFRIEDESNYYKLTLGTYEGDNGDSMSVTHNGKKFSTFDKDHDTYNKNCAAMFKGGWWYERCHHVNLNGRYYHYGEYKSGSAGIHWHTHDRHTDSMLASEMKMKMTV